MTSTGFDASLLCSIGSFSSAADKFKFPAKTRLIVESDCKKTIRASSSTTNRDSNKNGVCASYGRRGLVIMTSVPFLLPLYKSTEGFGAVAADEYFLIKEEIRKVLSKGKAAGVLRLVFHDAGTFDMDDNSGGMNGSIVYELDRPENAGLKKSLKFSFAGTMPRLINFYNFQPANSSVDPFLVQILEKAKSEVDILQQVSWADMIAVAGAEAVSVCGGPKIPVQLGRVDSMVPDPEGKLPQESLDASALKQCFQRKGLSTQELVALSGAHTLGSKGFGNPVVFDNSYYKILLEKPWSSSAGMSSMIGLPSDRALVEDGECIRWISKYADNQDLFFGDFMNAYIKLVNSGARWKNSL